MATFTIITGSLLGCSVFLARLGLPFLPSSVLVKSAAMAGAVGGSHLGFLGSIAKNVLAMDEQNIGIILLLIATSAVVCCIANMKDGVALRGPEASMTIVLSCLIVGHALAGKFGWFERYEVYILLDTALLSIYLSRGAIRRLLADRTRRRVLVSGAAVSMLIIGARYIRATALVPIGANNVYEQQMQMHRFVTEFYQGPVAVNDIGLVSYRNPYFVLDLWGLASEKARALNSSGANATAYRDLVSGSGVHLVIDYADQFPPDRGADWEKVASMDLSRHCVSVA